MAKQVKNPSMETNAIISLSVMPTLAYILLRCVPWMGLWLFSLLQTDIQDHGVQPQLILLIMIWQILYITRCFCFNTCWIEAPDLVVKYGLFRKRKKQIHLHLVKSIVKQEPLLGKLFGYMSIKIIDHSNNIFVSFKGVKSTNLPLIIRQQIIQLEKCLPFDSTATL